MNSEVKCLFCGHHVAERPFSVFCNIMCKWVNEKDYCTMFEPAHTMEEGWVPVAERLPEENGDYIVTVEYFELHRRRMDRILLSTRYTTTKGWWLGSDTGKVLAWMPAPEPYKGE